MKMLMEDIKKKQFKNAYLLMGEETYLRNQYRKRLRDALIDPEDTMNFSSFEGKKTDPKQIIDLAETMPFFAERRVIELQDSGFASGACQELADYIPEIPESTCLILSESAVDKRTRVYKAIKKYGRVVEFERQKEGMLVRWVLGLLKKEGKSIQEQTMHLFLQYTGPDMERIVQELEKLLSYTLGRDVITPEDVREVCTELTQNRIFDMIQAVTEQDQRRALDRYADLLAMKEKPERILALIAREYHILLVLKELTAQGIDRKEMAKIAEVPPFTIGRYLSLCRRYPKEQLRAILEDCIDMEERVKTGRIEKQISVELLIVRYSSRQTDGKR